MDNNQQLIEQSLAGNKTALEELIKKHQTWIFNVALHLTADANDAADLMQEVLIKLVTNLSKFKQQSEFRTWVYRIIKNHFLNTKRSKQYMHTIPWEEFGNGLDANQSRPYIPADGIDKAMVVEEAKLSCMKAMLLCLTPEQRMVYVMGELFEVPDSEASEVLEISKANFRKRLSRARTQLYGFMNNKCGLINKNNPCRCARKTTGFIKQGYVDPNNLQFQKRVIATIEATVGNKIKAFSKDGLQAYQQLYQQHYYLEPEERLNSLKQLMSSDTIKGIFDLN